MIFFFWDFISRTQPYFELGFTALYNTINFEEETIHATLSLEDDPPLNARRRRCEIKKKTQKYKYEDILKHDW